MIADIVTWQDEGLKWGSHLPAVLGCVSATKGPVLEISAGHYSTPSLHALCAVQGRRMVTVEKQPEWLELFRPYESASHEILPQTDELLATLAEQGWGVVLVDDLGAETRVQRLATFFDHADYMLFHDYQFPAIKDSLDAWLDGKDCHTYVYERYLPSTLIISKHLPIPNFAP